MTRRGYAVPVTSGRHFVAPGRYGQQASHRENVVRTRL